ncbi:hypothetical protein CCMSSC00406_0005979 [Pleurotus cornucopiae]|uniref:Uncharacterized protein n=1 Tax=Pleurotus cornucopiae TaxID=5321 RepID=A0ACB7IQB7_PLECO|nr:hypothetical protein CCMSSC00406_0005979 [Pleurotus cornucopiae]
MSLSAQYNDSRQQLREVQDKCATLSTRLEALEKELASYKKQDGTCADGDQEGSEPFWDDGDGVYRCDDCLFEVVDGACQSCGRVYTDMELSIEDSISTNNEALNPDRTSHPRGTTPLLDVRPHLIPPMYVSREDEYEELLARGATRLMCGTFELQFRPRVGIIAWADQNIFDEFTGEGMKKGDRWKIRLGRCIQLDEEDLDGSQFVEDFLEDAVLFPLQFPLSNRVAERWETVEVTPGVWETRPMLDVDDQCVQDDAEGDVGEDAGADGGGEDGDNEYEEDDDSDMDDDLYDPQAFPGLVDTNEAHIRYLLQEDLALGPLDDVDPQALGISVDPDNVVVQAGYESDGSASTLEDREGETISVDVDESDADPGWEISADVSDAAWPGSDFEEADWARKSKTLSPSDEVDGDEDMDSYSESDLDSAEMLSGDEAIVRK